MQIPLLPTFSVYAVLLSVAGNQWCYFGITSKSDSAVFGELLRKVPDGTSQLFHVWRHVEEAGGSAELEPLTSTFTEAEAKFVRDALAKQHYAAFRDSQWRVVNLPERGETSKTYIRRV